MKEELKSLFAEIVGLNNVIDDPALFGPYTDDFTDHYVSKPLAVVRPSTTEQVSKIVKLCAQYNVPIVTQGGNTSLTVAATTYRPDAEIVLSMTKMKNVIDADPLSDTLTVQAGMTLAIEPMINIGRPDVAWTDDYWTVVTDDGSLSAHYENTILITKGEPEILSL